MRYFLEFSYNGTRFNGWQVQPNAPSVQATIEAAFVLILRLPSIEIVGCGRTDTGVHARQYFAHFDYEGVLPNNFLERANKMVGKDIALKRLIEVKPDAHARFDAFERSYQYIISFQKNPFFTETEWHFTQHKSLNINDMQKAAAILRGYDSFAPFCKTHSDAQTMTCHIKTCEWIFADDGALFNITANRFLRGMVRLIVGACINVGLGQISLEDVKEAMDKQTPLKKSLSVPPTGLFLTDIKYGFEL
jgi:tRNA pseudouridine38-40 synthase